MHDIHYKTLVIRFSSVGDIVLSSPLVRAIRQRYPNADVDFLVKDIHADLVRHNPHLTSILTFPNHGGIRDLLTLRRELRRRRYDTILDIHGSLRSRALTFGLRGVRRVRKRILARTILIYCKRDLYRFFGGAPGVAERYLETFPVESAEGGTPELELFIPSDIQARARALLATRGVAPEAGMIGICPSARHWTKIWPEERFASLAAALARQWNAPVILFGGADDQERCGRIAASIAATSPETTTLDLSGACSLLETAALMDFCSVIVTNDSGLMHIASARKRPVVAIFGSTVRQFGFYPVGPRHRVVEVAHLPCRPCSHIGRSACPRGHFRCMLDVTPERVLETVSELVRRDHPPVSAPSSIS